MKIIEVLDTTQQPPIKHQVKVDDADYPALKLFHWIWRDGYAVMRRNKHYYQMHRMIMNVGWKDPILVDHKDGDHTNNQRSNLRKANRFQNQQNRKTNEGNTLPKGIRLLPSGKYNVRVQSYGKRTVVGTYDTLEQALDARNDYAKREHGEFFRPSHPLEV